MSRPDTFAPIIVSETSLTGTEAWGILRHSGSKGG